MVIFSCNESNKQKKIISPKIMKNILADMILTNSYVTNYLGNINEKQKDSINILILKKYNLDTASFNHSYNYYLSDFEILDSLLKDVETEVNRIIPAKDTLYKNLKNDFKNAEMINLKNKMERDLFRSKELPR